jgi:RimJ/RimL family protein N-acetyltransferase
MSNLTENKNENENEVIFTFIDGEIISLAPLKMDHVDLYVTWRNRPNVRIFGRGIIPATAADIKKQIEPPNESKLPNGFDFELWHKKDKKPIGDAGVFDIDWYNRKAFLGLMIGEPEYWNQDIGTEATQLLVQYAFNELNLHKLHASIFSPNKGSIRCAEKNGFKLEATFKDDIFIDGEYMDTFIYTLFKKDWSG